MTIDPQSYSLFMLSSLVLLLTPGPAVLYIITRSVHQGKIAGVVSAAGLGVGNFFVESIFFWTSQLFYIRTA